MNESIIDILLVEDNPHDVELTMEALQARKLANRVKVLRDGEEALHYIFRTGRYKEQSDARKNPVLILLDLNLPKVDGVEVLHRIKSDARTNTIPVVVLISSRSDMDRLKNDGFSANSYIVKPVEVENFIKAVGDVGFYWAVLNKTPRSTVE